MPNADNVLILYYRTLASQSAVSVSSNHLENVLRKSLPQIQIKSIILEKTEGQDDVGKYVNESAYTHVFYKVNFKDLDRLVANIGRIRLNLPNCKILLFGPFASLNAQYILSRTDADFVIAPNYELLADRYVLDEDIVKHAMAGVLTHREYYGVDLGAIYEDISSVASLSHADTSKVANLEATRGCPRKCNFCHVPVTHDKSTYGIFRKSPERIIQDVRSLLAMGKGFIIFNDSIFGGGGKNGILWLNRFCDLVEQENLSFKFMAYFTILELENSFDVIRRLNGIGMVRVFVGIESAATESNRELRKYMDSSNYLKIKNSLFSIGVVPHIGFMLFYPFISVDGLRKSLDFLLQTEELHRYGIVEEKTRVLNGTHMKALVERGGLITSSLNADDDPAYLYRFFDSKVQGIYDFIQKQFEIVGKPLLERIEYFQVTIEQILSYIGPAALCRQFFEPYWEVKHRWMAFFYESLSDVIEGNRRPVKRAPYIGFYRELRLLWERAIKLANASGVTDADLMIATGNLTLENARAAGDRNFLSLSVKGEVRVH